MYITYCERDLNAVKLTAVIIPLPILAPTFWELPLLGLGFAFWNDEKVAYLNEQHWSGLVHHLALLYWRVLSKSGLQDCNNFTDPLIANGRAPMPL